MNACSDCHHAQPEREYIRLLSYLSVSPGAHRTAPVALDDQYMALIDQCAKRGAVLAGVTSWAQVNGYRGETDSPEKMAGRIAHYLNYIRNWSFSLDSWILCLTVIRGFVHKNAY